MKFATTTRIPSIYPGLRWLLLVSGLLGVCSAAVASGDHHQHQQEPVVELSEAALSRAALSTAVAGPADIDEQATLYGQLQPEHTAVSHIRARYPGVVSGINVHIGDTVQEGDILATIHSNESLQEYQLRAPFTGMVTAKHAAPGEYFSNQVLFTVADYSQLWAELQVFPARMAAVKIGQTVRIRAGEQTHTGIVRSLVPASDTPPYIRARVRVDNREGDWIPGIFVQGQITVATTSVPLAVDNRALQELDGKPVVFVQTARNRFEARPLQLGTRGAAFSEVRGGIEAGARYVVENSYLLKADLKKSAAGHAH